MTTLNLGSTVGFGWLCIIMIIISGEYSSIAGIVIILTLIGTVEFILRKRSENAKNDQIDDANSDADKLRDYVKKIEEAARNKKL